MPVNDWDDPETERRAVERAQARRARIGQYRTQTNQAQAQRAAEIFRAYPHMSPGTVVPLAMSGEDANTPVTQEVAMREVKKKKGGGFGAALGDLVGKAVSFPVNAISEAAEFGTEYLVKPVVRGATAAGEALIQEPIGVARALSANIGNIGAGIVSGAAVGAGVGGFFGGVGAIPGVAVGAIAGGAAGVLGGVAAELKGVDVEGSGWRPQSTLGTALTGGGGMGTGYLPGGPAATEAAERARRTGRIGEHAYTPGRFFASVAFDEDTMPYKILSGALDATVAWKLDPTALAAGKYKAVRQGAGRFGRAFAPTTKALENERLAAGLVDGGTRVGVIKENAAAWLRSKKGTEAKEILAGMDNFEDVRRVLGPDVDFETVLDIVDNKTPEAIEAVLAPKLGLEAGLELKPKVGNARIKVKQQRDQVRFLQTMPRGGINLSQPEQAIEQFTRLQHTAKIPYEKISANNEAVARALRDGDISRAKAVIVKDFVGGPDGVLVRHKVAPELAKKMGDIWQSVDDSLRSELVGEIGNAVQVPAVRLGGETVQITSPHTMVEALDDIIDFDVDSIRNIRRVTSTFSNIVATPAWADAVGVGEFFTSKVWKVTALLRGSYFTRNLAEENLRMSAAGHDSAFNHPLSYLAWVAADDGKIARVLEKFGGKVGKTGRGNVDIVGRAFDENPIEVERALRGEMNNYAEALGREAQREGWLEGTLIRGRAQNTWNRGVDDPDLFTTALTEKLEKLHRDPVIRAMADPGRSAVRDAPQWPWDPSALLRDSELGPAIQEFATLTGARQLSTKGGRMPDPEQVRRWLGRSMRQAQDTAAGDSRLWDVLRTGEIDGISMRLPDGRPNPAFKQRIRSLVDEGVGPERVVGQAAQTAGFAERYNRGVNRFFGIVGGNLAANYSRSPTYRQIYWNEAKKMVTELNPEAQQELLDLAGEAGMKGDFVADLSKRAKAVSGELSREELDVIIGGRAMRETNKLLYNAVDRNQLSDILRVVFPFMEAQRNSMMTWARLGTENPAIARRVPQIINAAKGEGTFYTDPNTGEMMFVYPGSRFLSEKIFGMPIPLTGHVKGLNMVGSGLMPGAGPVVQMTARWFLPDKPRWDNVREMIDPFGDAASGGIVEQFAPGWLRNVITGKAADPDDRTFGDDIFQIVTADVSAGRSDVSTQEGMQEALEKAKSKARWLTVFKGFAQFAGSPTAMDPRFVAQDKDGRWQLIGALKEEYRKMQKDPEIGFEFATERFVEKFGTDLSLVMQGTTSTGGKILPDATRAANNWLRKHPELEQKYPAVIGLFAPSEDEADFDMQAWSRQREEEQRLALTPEQRIKLNNQRMANMVLYNVKEKFGPYPTEQQREGLQLLRTALKAEYPGFEEHLDLPENIKNEEKIAQLQEAVDDEELADQPVIGALKTYFTARDKLNQLAQASGRKSIATARDMAEHRAVLRTLAKALIAEAPEFAEAWDRVLKREIDIDEEAVVSNVA